ncbi:MAG: anaerobic ribonucleoside-triphosphate reductase activating protein [Lentisphaeria bacterium]|nr:anaerobic ribonucleoside-triphosphate reductase activating protein [Lentisphaeria bacterium]
MHYSAIKPNDIANGDGVRVSLFVSGCRNCCKGCFNPETWSFTAGELFDESCEEKILSQVDRYYINGLTLLGGDPFEIENQRGLINLIRKFRERFPDKTIWAYTGYIYDQDLQAGGKRHCEVTDELLEAISVLVDGPFVEELKDISLKFRGSSNQRLIDLNKTRQNGKIELIQ